MKKPVALCVALILPILLSLSPNASALAGSCFPRAAELCSDATNLVVKIKNKKNKKNNNNGGNDGTETQGTGSATDGGGHVCPAGYVTLDKPNKYGAFCEPKEGVCKKGLIGTPPNCACPEGTLPLGTGDNPCVAKENCPFPGQVGNPPNCACPDGTEFVGYKGCVKYEDKSTCEVESADTVADVNKKLEAFTSNCTKMQGKVKGPSDTIRVEPGEKPMVPLCCVVRYYEK